VLGERPLDGDDAVLQRLLRLGADDQVALAADQRPFTDLLAEERRQGLRFVGGLLANVVDDVQRAQRLGQDDHLQREAKTVEQRAPLLHVGPFQGNAGHVQVDGAEAPHRAALLAVAGPHEALVDPHALHAEQLVRAAQPRPHAVAQPRQRAVFQRAMFERRPAGMTRPPLLCHRTENRLFATRWERSSTGWAPNLIRPRRPRVHAIVPGHHGCSTVAE
jgi:hypothetical protein